MPVGGVPIKRRPTVLFEILCLLHLHLVVGGDKATKPTADFSSSSADAATDAKRDPHLWTTIKILPNVFSKTASLDHDKNIAEYFF